MKAIHFIWDNKSSEDTSNRDLIVGLKLPKKFHNDEATHIETYGICLSVIDNKKDFRLHRHSCYRGNMENDAKEITKEQARAILMAEIDKTLDVMFSDAEVIDFSETLYESETKDVELNEED